MASEPPFAQEPEYRADDEPIPPVLPASYTSWPPPRMGPGALPPDEDSSGVPFVLPAPRPPQPGFWFGALATFIMFVLCQIAIPIALVIIWMIAVAAVSGNAGKKFENLGTKEGTRQFQSETMLPLLVAAHVPMIVLGVIALRLFAGRQWYREIALRLPSPTHFILLILGFPALPILASGAYRVAQRYLPGLGELPSLFLSQLLLVGVFGVLWLVGRAQLGHDPKRDLSCSPVSRQLLMGLAFVAIAVVAVRGSFLLFSAVIPPVPFLGDMDKSMEDLVLETRNWPPLVAVLVIAVMPAFSEEIWCRAFLGRGMVGQYGVVCGVLITSYFFGAIHVLPHQGAMAMLMGLVLHYAYLTTRSLLAPMLLHFLNNATSVLGESLGKQAANIDIAPEKIPITLIACAALLMAAVAWALYQSRVRVTSAEASAYLGGHWPGYPGVALPPPGSGAALVQAWPSVPAIVLVLLAFGSFAAVFTAGTLGYQLP